MRTARLRSVGEGQRAPSCLHSSRGFTLIELLISVALIGLLIAMALPTVNLARMQARGARCAANLQQLGHAFHMYAAEWNGRALPLAYMEAGQKTYWWGKDTAGGVDHTAGFTWPYLRSELRDASVYECPEQRPDSYQMQGLSKTFTSTYGYNGYYLTPRYTPGWVFTIGHRPWQTLENVPNPAAVFAFADTMVLLKDKLKNCALLDPPFWYDLDCRGWKENPSPTTAFRHARRTNVVCVDGHVERMDLRGGTLVYPEFGLGSVGPENGPHYVPDWTSW
jgi:prepilin-type N-terminal cleavage/methylation domain-containing protein/prepilin-type processing-associated H-X9-DG protein